MKKPSDDFDALVPEMKRWNEGQGIDIDSWIGCSGNYELAIGYSRIFWPQFVAIGPYVLAAGNFSKESLASWEESLGNDRRSIEAVINHLHIADMHFDADENEQQCRYLGNLLREIYQVKLANDFADRSFEVVFNDEDGLDLDDYELTFYQI